MTPKCKNGDPMKNSSDKRASKIPFFQLDRIIVCLSSIILNDTF